MLPVQGLAAACAQICALVQHQQMAETSVVVEAASPDSGDAAADHEGLDHCGKSEMGAGKCCQSHTFLIELRVATIAATPDFFERDFSVACWTDFIPEEPSPPPIDGATIA